MEQLELESQQLVDILVQLGFTKLEPCWGYCSNINAYCDVNNELDVHWDITDGDYVFNLCGANYSEDSYICIQHIDGKSLATNIAYFQKQLNEKLNQESQHENN